MSKILFLTTVSSFLFSGNLGNEAIVVTKSDEVFAIGSNAAGCLGLGDLQSTLIPKKVEALCSKGVKGMIRNIDFVVVYAVGFIIVPKNEYSEMWIKLQVYMVFIWYISIFWHLGERKQDI